MEYLRFYDLEETYINEKSSLEYFNVSYTKDTDKTWVKEEPYLLMKFKVEEAIINNNNKVLTRKICNDLSVFKSIQIGNDEPINIEVEEKENIIDSNSFILNENDYFASTYIPEININGEPQCTLVINEQFTKDDCIVIFDRSYEYPYHPFLISELIGYGAITEINENTFDVGTISNGLIYFIIKKEGAELLSESSIITSDMLQYIISSSLKYKEIKNKIYLPSVEGEYMVKGVLNQSIDSLNSLFSNNVFYEYTENTNIYDDIEINNDYENNIINLISINIPKQISYLVNTFYECRKLKEVKIDKQSNLTTIGNEAFYNCHSLSSIDIPNSVTSIGDGAFYYCDSLTSITIPNSVTSIGRWAFTNCYSLTSITIPSGVTSISENAFANCTSLSNITIPSGVTSIGYYVFQSCYSLSSVTFEEDSQLQSIGNSVFSTCYSLTSITIPNSVTSIGNSVFSTCYSLTSITIPNSVTSIGDGAFSTCYSLTSITIPNSVTSIGYGAFRNCKSLSDITIGNSVTSIGYGAFDSCYSLSNITCLAETAPTISSNTFSGICSNGILYYPQDSDYSSWLSTSDYYLGKYNWIGVELQDSYDFKVNFITNGIIVDSPYNSLIINGIQSVKQGDNSYLFSGLQPMNGCYKFDLIADGEVIDTVDIKHKNKWITIGDNSSMLTCIYKPCQSTTIYSGSNLTYSNAYVDGVYVGKLSSSYTFNDVSEHIIQYSGVTLIANYAFYKCSSLSEIELPSDVTTIRASAFTYCYSLSNITIPNGVTLIGNDAFYYCSSLTSITIPNSVTYIGDRAFFQCFSLSSIDIPNSVTSIGNNVFYNCFSLSSITIGNSVTSIGDRAFFQCHSLSSINMPSGVTSIGNEAFAYCYSLSNITCLAETAPTISSNTFSGICSNGVLYYPQGSDYSSWLSTDEYYLGRYNWTLQEI